MLNKLIQITSSVHYESGGSISLKEVNVNPWEEKATLTVVITEDDWKEGYKEIWEIHCTGIALAKYVPTFLIPPSQIKVFTDHPLLWTFDDEIFFSIITTTKEIPALLGDLFIAHSRACGNWVDFQKLYNGLPETLQTMKENQLAIPLSLKSACFEVLDKYGVQYVINAIQENEKGYSVLFFSYTKAWPDEVNFRQPYIIAKQFSEQKIS